jgi:hypothetical protein
MTDQIYTPKRSESVRLQPTEKQHLAQDEWKAQLERLLDEYRNHYVLPPRSEGNPRA